ncbi:10549_t:CDS:2, partial [Diversispora eburnea]
MILHIPKNSVNKLKNLTASHKKVKDSERQSGGAPVVISFRTELDDILDEIGLHSNHTENTEITINKQTKKCSLPVTSTETSTLIESNDEDSENEPEPTSKKFAKIATDTQKYDEKKEIRKQRAKEKARRYEERCKLMSLLINI